MTRGKVAALATVLVLGAGVYAIAQTEDKPSGQTTGDAIEQCQHETTLTRDQCASVVLGGR